MRLTRTCNPRRVLLLDLASVAGRPCLKRKKVVFESCTVARVAFIIYRRAVETALTELVQGCAVLVEARHLSQGPKLPVHASSAASGCLRQESRMQVRACLLSCGHWELTRQPC